MDVADMSKQQKGQAQCAQFIISICALIVSSALVVRVCCTFVSRPFTWCKRKMQSNRWILLNQ